MENKCSKFEEKLSAYLDGNLPSEEMAEIAAHLESCEACSALLEKMRKLDDLASGIPAEFDDSMMDALADRISAGVEEVETGPAKAPETKARIIPIWYRYVAVAASIAVVFLIGRMAFDETDPDLKRHRIAPSILQQSPSPSLPPQATDEPVTVEQDDDDVSEDMRLSDEEALEPVPEKKEEIGRQKSALPEKTVDNDRAVEKPEEFIGSPCMIEVPAPVADEENQLPRSKKIAQDEIVDEGLGEASDVAVEPSMFEEQSPVAGGRKKGKDSKVAIASMEMTANDDSKESAILTVDSLKSIYFAYSSAFIDNMNYADGKGVAANAALQKSIVKENKYMMLIDSVESIPEKSKNYRRFESLYLMARANHDLYLQTKDRNYLDRAIQYRSALLELINEQLEEDEGNDLLLEYKSEIDNWRF